MSETHLVTGGSGFIASHVVRELLEAGYTVHTTVRSTQNTKKMMALFELQTKFPNKLKVFEADLLQPGSFSDAMAGCAVVHHVASPFLMPEHIKDPQTQMIDPALNGVRNVLESVNQTKSVRRVIQMSSVCSMMSDYSDTRAMKDGILHEDYWNTRSSLNYQPYQYSKTIAEKEAWKIHDAQSRWKLVCINPGMVFGPSLTSSSESGSLEALDRVFSGKMWYGLPDLGFCLVDVREVAFASRRAAEIDDAHGRYILCLPEMTSWLEISRHIKPRARNGLFLPWFSIPTWLVRIFSPFIGIPRSFVDHNMGIYYKIDSERSVKELGVHYRPVYDTIDDHYDAWLAHREQS